MSCGICRDCGEWTDIEEPCCDAPVWFEGDWISPQEFEESENESDQNKTS